MNSMTRLMVVKQLVEGLRKRSRKGFTLIELLVVVVIIGILASVALPSFVGAQDKARNASVAANVNTVRMALEQYGTDNNGSYPAAANVLNNTTGIIKNNYLPGNKMPKAPWSTGNQTVAGVPVGVGMPTVTQIADGTSTLGRVGDTIIATGKVVTTAPAATTDYGFVAYDYAPDDQVYVLYGTGKKNAAGVIAGGASNGSN